MYTLHTRLRDKRRLGDIVTYSRDMYDTVVDADAVVMLTEWKQFRLPSWNVVARAMRGNLIVDGRNIYQPDELEEAGLRYRGIGIRSSK